MDVGLGMSVLGLCAILVAAIIRMPTKLQERMSGERAVQKEVCDERHTALNVRLAAIEQSLKEIVIDIRALLARMEKNAGGSHNG